MVTTEQIKELRDKTGVSMMQCKQALEESGGNMEDALKALAAKGAAIAEKKSDRTLGAGVISSYIHNTKTIGVMLELNCETDFVARNPEFSTLATDLCLHVTAMMPENVEALLAQPYVKNPEQTVAQLIDSYIQKFGERIVVGKFVRYNVLG